MASVTVRNLVTDSLMEIGVQAGGQSVSAEDADFCVTRLNQVFDNYNAMKEASYVLRFDIFPFVASQQSYTIGPEDAGPDFIVLYARPTRIVAASVVLVSVTPAVKTPITIRDYQWWDALSVDTVTSTFPTDVYYAPDWPLGVLHFWPVPTVDENVELVTANTFGQVTINDTLDLPSGYHSALMLTLAEDIAGAFGRPVSPITAQKAREARNRIFSVNDFIPRLQTRDAGMPGADASRSAFNYKTGRSF